MSSSKINKLKMNYNEMGEYIKKLDEEKFFTKHNKKIKLCVCKVLKVVKSDVIEPGAYVWVEKILPQFEHFWNEKIYDNKIDNKEDLIVSAKDPFLVELQKEIYRLSGNKKTLCDIQGYFNKDQNTYELSDLEFTNTMSFYSGLLGSWCKMHKIEYTTFKDDSSDDDWENYNIGTDPKDKYF